ncbi:MAG: XdhC family protein [Actinomycetota bacterium]
MLDDFLKKSAELIARGELFATATVVRCQAPSSGKPGDKAIIHPNGEIWGWIGGGCAQPVVIKEALKSLADHRPRLVRISPSADGSEEGIVDYTMTCHSGGALDIYIEPVLPSPHVVVLGRSPIAQALARLSRDIGYAVSVVAAEELKREYFADAELLQAKDFNLSEAKITPKSFVVVSTQGEGDEEALEQAVKSEAGYVAFVASKTKSGKVFEYLRSRGISQAKLDQVHAPAGLNIGAGSPQEIAVSILAEIVKLRNSANIATATHAKPAAFTALPVLNSEAKDPVCGMMVDTAKARHKTQFQGQWVYFCCAGCKDAFERSPEKYSGA